MKTNMELFDEYLNGDLTSVEKGDFERKLKEDENFMAAFQQHKNAIRAIEFVALKDKLGQISRDAQASKTVGRRSLIAIAAAVTLLVGAYFFIIDRVGEPLSPEQIYASIHFKDPGLPTLMGESGASKVRLDEFMLLYKQNKYDEAMVKAEELILSSDLHDTVQFYVAMMHLEIGEVDRAAELLETLEIKEGIIGQKAEWYRYMIDLRRGDFISAEAGIRLIAEDPSHIFRLEAIEALEILRISLNQ